MSRRLGLLLVGMAMTLGCGPQDGGEAPRGAAFVVPEDPGGAWFKGNTHTHTTESDGDTPPAQVVEWYRTHGYDFLVLTDHNVLTDPSPWQSDPDFLLIPGEEVTSQFEDAPVHVNGLGLLRVVEPRTAASLVATIQANVDAIREVEGVPHVNHPNFQWAFGAAELAQVEGDRLLEIFNGHPTVHNQGGGGVPGMEAVWDALLTGGKEIYGIAVDDAHHFQGEFAPDRANPGRGWVAVRAPALTADAILTALEVGGFYASTGVELEDVIIEERTLELRIRQDRDFKYVTTFIGAGGDVLATSEELRPRYVLGGGEHYVRARVVSSRGDVAWTQPVFTRR